jgi:transposase
MSKKKQTAYDEQFRRDAVALWKSSDKSQTEIAKSLGIHPTSLGGWIKRYSAGANIDAGKGDVDEENKRLKKELNEARQTVELLKKATAFFAVDELRKNKG